MHSVLNHYAESAIWDYYSGVASQLILDQDYKHTFHIEYTNIEKLPDLIIGARTIASSVDSDSHREVKEFRNGHLLTHRGDQNEKVYDLYGFYKTVEEAEAVYAELIKHKPTPKEKLGITPIHFWHLAKAPKRTIKDIETPKWEDITQNYPSNLHDDLKDLMELNPDDLSGGKIILWRGEPGTGKTWGIRSLTNAWKGWCTAHYIIDLENFFGSSVNYMLNVVTKLHINEEDDDDDNILITHTPKVAKNKWNLLICEDAGDYVSTENKTGALTKLLNIGDGLLGQGMNLLILITTNQALDDINPAISRQGRCLSNLEFPSFTLEEAGVWLKNHGHDGTIPASRTLSDLYSTLPNSKKKVFNKTVVKRKMGFT